METVAKSLEAASSEPQEPPEPLLPLTLQFVAGITLGVPAFLELVRYPIRSDTYEQVALYYVSDVVVAGFIAGILLFAYAVPLPRILPRIQSRALRIALHTTTLLGGVWTGLWLATPIVDAVCSPRLEESTSAIQSKLIALMATVVVVAAALAYERLQRENRDIERRAEQARRAAVTAQLQALQARTNPHFLFNSLNTVASLIPTRPECAEETLERLSGLFRYSLEGARKTRVRLGRELSAVCDYLDVEALRLGDRLSWRLSVDEELDDVHVPPLLLQPLVENAVLHAVAPRREGGKILIEGRLEGDEVMLSVEDDGPGPSANKPLHRGTGTSLADLEKRLEVAYGAGASVARSRGEAGGMRVTLRFPKRMLHESPDR